MLGAMNGSAIRRARHADAAAVAGIYLSSFRATYDFPLAHTDDEIRGWIEDHVVARCETWLSVELEPDSAPVVVGYIVLDGPLVVQLDVLPGRNGEGIGSTLIGRAKTRRPDGLELWTFQVNAGARRFYERHGFVPVETTDGSHNEEGQPDVRYRWRA
jgi:GNAT superfamily N-acetyltransferase